MRTDIAEKFALLFDKNNNTAYEALRILQKESEENDAVYSYMDKLGDMLDSGNSYIRTRGLILIAYNAKWDKDCKIDKMLDKYLNRIADSKPVTARKCIKLLPMIAKSKPELKSNILAALRQADVSFYAESMRQLIYGDIQEALTEIQKQREDFYFSLSD